jgi:hypothetical protein
VHSYRFYRRLEQRFDGEIPDYLRRLALAGGQSALEIAAARANSLCCDGLALSAVRVAAARRAAVGDLNIWRREGLAWQAAKASIP